MAILNADCLLAHAHALAASSETGQRLQIDLRRSVSAAYYALFHTVATTAAQQALAGGTASQAELSLAIRAIGHSGIARVCRELAKSSPPSQYVPHIPPGGFGTRLRAFMAAFPMLQEQRHRADYDILPSYDRVKTIGIIASAREAKADFWNAPAPERRAFLLLVLFPVRH